ncbi:5-(carboxyamino)imidazole ribonucleotide synthase [Ornithinibacillus sp. 179-J 7C1 HS]|uniref:5-(carboxyamino)imidazole ribonucleotide synthase n=1 Tax=Ornithinibacillus sp. 179-J 7C1 HS TaxID=3142384 RepID=UPI0039A16457
MQSNNVILPPQTIGIIGGGQLGRMMAMAAKYMGYRVIVLDPAPNCPTAQVADEQIIAPYDDLAAIKELTAKSDVVTYEFENVDLQAATYIEKEGKLPQGAYALEVTQNREKEKTLMKELHLPVPEFFIVRNGVECQEALKKVSFPVVIKTCRGGYDGKGQFKLNSKADIPEAIQFAEKNNHCIIESWISFDREISIVFTRTATGIIEFFPVAENVHKNHILFQTTAPANVSEEVQQKARKAATLLANKMNVVGTFAIEMFVSGEEIYLNEMAPRPHNSGHYTIEACNISQFAQHIRAICGLPLIPVNLLEPSLMINILGEDVVPTLRAMAKVNQGFVHLYGKDEAKAKRKMGHITFIGENNIEQVKQFEEAKQ